MLLFCLFCLFLFAPGPDEISASIVATFWFDGGWHSLLKVSGWSALSVASFVAFLCSVAVGYVLHYGVTITSHGVVTHDYLRQVVEHLKGPLDANHESTDWCITEVQKLCKQVGEQERKFAQLLQSLGEKKTAKDKQEQGADEKAHKDAAEHNAAVQQLDHRLALLERILSDMVSTGVN